MLWLTEHNSKEYYQLQSGECCKRMKERYELINDISDIKRKAEAFDEIAVTVLSEDNDVIKNMDNIVTKIVINNLERGSDE